MRHLCLIPFDIQMGLTGMTTDGLFEFDIVPSDYVAEEDGETGTDTGTDTGTGDPEGDSPPPPPVNSPPQVNGVI